MLEVRPATESDIYPLRMWANDVATGQADLNQAHIEWTDHVEWFRSQFSSACAAVLIRVAVREQPVGSIRFDTVDEWSTVRLSFVVAPEARGHGYGRALVETGMKWLGTSHSKTST